MLKLDLDYITQILYDLRERMKFNLKTKGLFRPTWLFLCGACFLAFIAFFVAYYLYDTHGLSITALEYARSYYVKALYFVMPLLIGAAMIFTTDRFGVKAGLIKCASLPTALLFYTLPYYYIYYVFVTLDSLDALLFAILGSLLDCLVFYLEGALLCFIATYAAKRISQGRSRAFAITSDPFDFSSTFTVAVFIGVSFKAFITLIFMVVDTVGYLVEYSGTYRVSEITAMVLDYLFLLVMLVLSHLLVFAVKNRIQKRYERLYGND